MDPLFNEYEIKVVTKDDEEKVLSIRKPDEVYEGHDYLPDKFKQVINFSNSTGYAVSRGETYIAFTVVSILDNGETYILRAIRVAKEYEGKGIMKWFLIKIDEILKNTTAVKYRVTTTDREDAGTARRIKEERCYTVVDRELVYFWNEIEVQKLKPMFEQFNSLSLTIIDTNDSLSGILDLVCLTDYKYGRKIVANLIPFRPIKSNVTLIMQETNLVIGSNLENKDRLLITFGSSYEALVGTVLYIQVYGHDRNEIKCHIMFHLKHVLDTCRSKRMTLAIGYDLNIPGDFIENIMKNCCFITNDKNKRGYLCVETKY